MPRKTFRSTFMDGVFPQANPGVNTQFWIWICPLICVWCRQEREGEFLGVSENVVERHLYSNRILPHCTLKYP